MEMEIHIFRDPDQGFLSVPMPKGSKMEEALAHLSGGIWPKPEPEYNPATVAAKMGPEEIFNIDRHGEVAGASATDTPEYYESLEYYDTISATEIDAFGGY